MSNFQLVYLWVEKFRTLENIGINFHPRFNVEFNPETRELKIKEKDEEDFRYFPKNQFISVIVGKNGTGKSSVLDLIEKIIERSSVIEPNNDFLILRKEEKILIKDKDPSIEKNIYINGYELLEYKDKSKLPVKLIKIKNIRNFEDDFSFQGKKLSSNEKQHRFLYNLLKCKNYKFIESILNFNKDKYIKLPEKFTLRINTNNKIIKFLEKDPFMTTLIQNNLDKIHLFSIKFDMDNLKEKINNLKVFLTAYYFLGLLTNIKGDNIEKAEFLNKNRNILERIIFLLENLIKKKDISEFFNELEKLSEFFNELESLNKNHFEEIIKDLNKLEEIIKDLNKLFKVLDVLFEHLDKAEIQFWENNIILRINQIINNREKINKVVEFLNVYSSLEEKFIIKVPYEEETSRYKNEYALEFSFEPPLSSGQEALLSLFSQISRHLDGDSCKDIEKEENVLLLLDEPDVYLHPEWQRLFIYFLTSFLKEKYPNKHFHIILTTHSPFLLSDIPKENVIFLDLDDNYKTIVKSKKEISDTLAQNIYYLLSDGFFMEKGIGEYVSQRLKYFLKKINEGNLIEDEEKKFKRLIDRIGDKALKHKLEHILRNKEFYKEKLFENKGNQQ